MKAFGMKYQLNYRRGYPVTFNHAGQTDFATSVTKEAFGSDAINTEVPPTMGSEDFSYMLEERPGAFINIGNGESAGPVSYTHLDVYKRQVPPCTTPTCRVV